MDIPRAKPPKRLRYMRIGLAASGLLLLTILLGSLKPAAPTVQLSTVQVESVRRSQLVREVRGPGALIPEQIRWISALTPSLVGRILIQPGDSVTAETVLL